MRITTITSPSSAVGQYVLNSSVGRLCHLPEWGITVARSLGHEPLYLLATEQGRICGVLPLTVIRSRLFGHRMISQAFCNYGGPLTDRADLSTALVTQACQVAGERGCPVVEFRNCESMAGEFLTLTDKVCMILSLAPDPDTIWQRLKPEIRNRVRKARRAGLRVMDGGSELLDDFYEVWTIRMRQLGTPCYPRRLFADLLKDLSTYTRIFLVKGGETTWAAGFFHRYKGLAECRWAAARIDSWAMSPNTLLYWAAIEYYCRTGDHSFDFGRSTMGSSQYEFKRRWGTRQSQLYYQYWAAPGHDVSPIRPDNPRYVRFVALWRRLPLFVTRICGPWISRCLP